MALAYTQIDDIVALVRTSHEEQKWVDLTQDLQHLIFVSNFLDTISSTEEDGPDLSWTWQIDELDTAKATAPFDVDTYDVKNLVVQPTVGWTHQTANWIYDYKEKLFNRSRLQILDHLSVRAHSVRTSLFNFLEKALWTAGASTDSPALPAGIPYWITQTSAASGFDFTGANHGSHAAGPGGVSRTTYPKTKNGNGTYAILDDDDGLASLSKAIDYCYFTPADPYAELAGGKPKWWLYTTYTNIQRMQRLMGASNDNIGRDLGKYRGIPMYRSVPVRYVPALENSAWPTTTTTNNPIYGININTWKWVFQAGEKMKTGDPVQLGDRHTQRAVHIDNTGQFKCLNPRSNFVLIEA